MIRGTTRLALAFVIAALMQSSRPAIAEAANGPDTASHASDITPDRRRVELTLTIPWGNWFVYNHSVTRISRFGFYGLVLGADFLHRNSYYFSARVGAATNAFFIPAPVDYCIYDFIYEALTEVRLNRRMGKFSLGAGLHWLWFDYDRDVPESNWCNAADLREFDFNGQSLGLSLQVQRTAGEKWYLELNYLPTLLLRDRRKLRWRYSHTMFFGITRKFTP